MRRIVVTGLGAVSPLGCGVGTNWVRLLEGRSGIGCLPAHLANQLRVKIAGQVPARDEDDAGFAPDPIIPPRDQRKMDRFIQFALVAAHEAIEMAGLTEHASRFAHRTATIIATGIGGFPPIAGAVRTSEEKGVRRLLPYAIPSFLANLAAGHVSIRYGFTGPIGAPVTACAAGVQAIGDAARLIRSGEADIGLCGGSEACIDVVSLGGFAAARALAAGLDGEPAKASRPFDANRTAL